MRGEDALLAVAGLATVVGVLLRRADPVLGWSATGALAGVISQLGTTLPAAGFVSAALLLDLAAGAFAVRLLRRQPFASWSDAVLGAYAGAILLDLALVAVLAGVGIFRQVPVAISLGSVVILGWRRGPLVASPWRLGRPRPVRWLLVGLVWSTVVIVVLASPVVPFVDELPNHVAPAEHLRVFGAIGSLAAYPSPLYGPSRLFLGYEALMGTLATLTDLPAAIVVEASVLGVAVISAVAARRLASAAFGREAGYWALLAFVLTFTFVRLPDARDSVVALPLAALALALLVGPERQLRRLRPAPARADWPLAAALAAATLVHPLVGMLTAATVVIVTLADPGRYAARTVPALLATAIVALPQAAVMLGLAPPPVTVLLAYVAGGLGALITARAIARLRLRRVDRGAATVAIAGLSAAGLGAVALVAPSALAQAAGWINPAFPTLFIAAAVAVAGFVPTSRGGRRVVAAAIAAGVLALVGTAALQGDSLPVQSLRYEVPKAVGYWLPWACVSAAAGLVASVARWRGPSFVRIGILAIALAVTLLPLGPARLDSIQASHAVADDLAYDLQLAERGYWQGYPDPRRLVDPARERLLAFLRGEVAAGRIGSATGILHVASSYEPWGSVPIAAFTGIDETLVSADAATTIFTAGGRVDPFADLATELASGFAYVVVEPAGLSSATVEALVLGARYRRVYSDAEAWVFARGTG